MSSIRDRVIAFVRALTVLVALAVVVPIGLLSASTWRFGGGFPLHGVPGPVYWRLDRVGEVLGSRLTDRAIADALIRMALVVAWTALIVFVITVLVEIAHMVRHGGLHLPDVRGLAWSQRGARVLAAGVLALLPLLSTSGQVMAATGRGGPTLLTRTNLVEVVVDAPVAGLPARATPPTSTAAIVSAPAPDHYVVRSGDSVYGIARHVVGADATAVADYAERIVDLNIGREMGDGQRFTNPGYIDVGWVLELPPAGESNAAGDAAPAVHTVVAGESLWSIADELGDPSQWPELYRANVGREFADGQVLDEPSLLLPGWDLLVPVAQSTTTVVHEPAETQPATVAVADQPVVATAEVVVPRAATAVAHDAHHHDAPRLVAVAPAAVDSTRSVPQAPSISPPARPENVWVADHGDELVVAPTDRADASAVDSSPVLITFRRAAMLAGGVLTLLAVRRRRRLREAQPHARLPVVPVQQQTMERELALSSGAASFARVDLAVRAATLSLVAAGERVLAVLSAPTGDIELIATGPANPPAMWRDADERWMLPASVPLERLADDARQVNAPSPTLVQLGVDDCGNDVYVDLEAIGTLEIGGPPAVADAIVAALAATLAGSVLAEETTLVSAGVPDDAFLGHRLHVTACDLDEAFAIATRAVGSPPAADLFELRARGTSGEAWAPAVVLVGAGLGRVRRPHGDVGVGVVSAAPVDGPSSRLAPEGEAWMLRPCGLSLQPIGLVPDDISAIGRLLEVPAAVAAHIVIDERLEVDSVDDDRTVYVRDDSLDLDGVAVAGEDVAPTVAAEPGWDLLVRLFGPVAVIDRGGQRVTFERSKTTELVAWLATHRERSTRSNARTALWEQDVRDATFANVVSEARRALARLVPPPTGDEWIARR